MVARVRQAICLQLSGESFRSHLCCWSESLWRSGRLDRLTAREGLGGRARFSACASAPDRERPAADDAIAARVRPPERDSRKQYK